jgi:hypothetical protein
VFRLIAILAVVGAFGATLYYGGDYLESWESPRPASAQAATGTHKKKAKKNRVRSAPRARARRRTTSRKPEPKTWAARFSELCRRGEAEAAAIPPPITLEGSADYFRQFARLNKRWNREAAALLERGDSRDPQAVRQLRRLFDKGESLVADLVVATERRQFKRYDRILPAMIALAKSENRLLARLGAPQGCILSEDAFQ